MAMKPSICIDGLLFHMLEAFFQHFAERAFVAHGWVQNLDAFNDVLRGGFSTPEGGFVIEWLNHAVSKQYLGYAETIRQLQLRLERCHPDNVSHVQKQLDAAKISEGPTVYDWLLEIIRTHCAGGEEEEDNVELLLH